jgi:formate C-acetyltransferase
MTRNKGGNITMKAWEGFVSGNWQEEIDVRQFIQLNYEPYEGDASFLVGSTEATQQLWEQFMELAKQERDQGGVLDMDTEVVSSIISHEPGYLNKELEVIVGIQTDKPFKRALQPYGGIRMAKNACESYGYELDPEIEHIFSTYRKTHNQGVFDGYSPAMSLARKAGVITGLPDAYGRGRIIGDYRRVALYGTDFLAKSKKDDLSFFDERTMSEDVIRAREEIAEQLRALTELKQMAASYGFDITKPAETAQEAFQWLYFGYLAAIKEQNGAAMSLGRTSTFLDIYIARDLKEQRLTEQGAQELVDHFVMKLRMVKFARTPEYNALFSGDPTWVTESLGGIGLDGRPLVTKTTFRFLHTLETLGPSPEPNLTVLWSGRLPQKFKEYCARMTIQTSSLQYENDDLMRTYFGDDYGIACCVSAMRIGKQMQYFGARANLAKALLYAINGGMDEQMKVQITPPFRPLLSDKLDFEEVMAAFDHVMEWLAELYINTLNVIHYMHDKYCYERIEMALHDQETMRTMATGIAGLSVVTDSLSAIKYANVRPVRDENGLAVDYIVEGEYPAYGNNDNRADDIAIDLVKRFYRKLKKHSTYREARTTMSVLTITSNVVYGKLTGNTPDGRKKGEPFAPGANPMHGRDRKGAIASLASVAKLPYEYALDGISNTFSIIPGALGKNEQDRIHNLTALLDGYTAQDGHHLNINVFDTKTLLDAMEHPEEYPQLTIRVSGYAVNFIKLTREQQLDVINRTFHEKI